MDEEYFKSVYAADKLNQKRQSLEGYLEWATGKRGLAVSKWGELTREIVAGFPADVSPRLQTQLQAMGNRAIAEWAKDNSTRAFDERLLKKWAKAIKNAREADPGDGSGVEAALRDAVRELDALIKGRGVPLL